MKSEQSSRGTSRRTGPAGGTASNVCAETGAFLPLSGHGRASSLDRGTSPATLRAVSARLAVETFAARAAARMSRLAGAGGGTTLPGKLLWKLDPGAIDALAARLPQGAAVVSATNGKTTTTAMVAEILGRGRRLAWNRSGANLVSGVASTLARAARRRAGAARGRRGRAAGGRAPRPAARRPARRTSSETSSTATASSSTSPSAGAPQRRRSRPTPSSSSTGTIRRWAISRATAPARSRSGSTIRGTPGRRSSTRPTRATACAAGGPTSSRRPTSATSATTAVPTAATRGRQLQVRATEIELDGLEAASFTLETPEGSIRLRLPLPGLYNVYNALGAAALAQALGTPLEEIRAGLERFGAAFGRFERIAVGDKQLLILLIKNPAGANEVVHTLLEGGAPTLLLVALNDAIADGKDVSWIWDVDFEPLLGRAERLIASGDRAAELAVRCVYGGLDEDALEVEPDLERALDRGLELTPPGGELDRPPHLHGDARAAADRDRARPREAVLGALVRIRVGHLYPDYLNIYADRGNIAVFDRRARLRGHELDVTAALHGRRGATRRARSPLHRRRPGPRAGAGRAGPRREGPGDRGRRGRRRGAPRRLRRLPAARPRLRRTGTATSLPGIGLFPHETVAGERRMIGDVLLEMRARAGRAPDDRGVREPRRPDAARPGRRAARPRRRRLRERRRVRLRGRAASAARSAPTCTARCCRGTRGSRTGCSRRRSRTRRAASRRSSSRCPTASRPRRTRSRRSEPATAAAAIEVG